MAWTQEEFNNWKKSPVTKTFFAHLKAVRADLAEQWASGAQMDETDRSIAMVYGDIVDLNYEMDIVPFYETEESTEDDQFDPKNKTSN